MSHQIFHLPDLGEGLTEAELARWLVDVGDEIAVDSPVAEVETAKAVVEVPSPFGGVVAKLHGQQGDTFQVGQPVISITEDAEDTGSGNVLVGYGTGALPENTRRRRRNRRNQESTSDERGTVANGERPTTKSPVVRRLARERGVDLGAVTGSGPGGLITRGDVEAAAPRGEAPAPQAPPPEAADERTGLPIRARIPFDGVRKAITRTLSRSRQEIPEATTWVDVDATELVEYRASLANDAPADDQRGPGLMALVSRFVVAGLLRYPALNARVETEHIVEWDGVHLGIATQTERGLLVPAVRDAHRLSARQLDAEIRRVTSTARAGKASAGELGSSSFTFNNYGRFNVDGSAAIINHPEVAILGMGRVIQRPWVVEDRIVPRSITQLSLAFDHRVCDAETAAGFLRFVADAIEAPSKALPDL